MKLTRPLYSNAVKLFYDKISPSTTKGMESSPIIIMHGLLGNRNNNRSLGRYLTKYLHRDVYLLDMRNHGKSPVSRTMDYDSMSNDVIEFVHSMEFSKKPILVGHSMGSKVGMTCVLKNPDCASELINIENVPVVTEPSGKFVKYIDVLNKICSMGPKIKNMGDAIEVMSRYESNRDTVNFLLTNIKRKSETGQGYEPKIPLDILKNAVIKGEISGFGYPAGQRRWTKPTLFLRGSLSDYIVNEYIPAIGQTFPQFEVYDVEDGDHFVNAKKPDQCARLIHEFVTRHEDAPKMKIGT